MGWKILGPNEHSCFEELQITCLKTHREWGCDAGDSMSSRVSFIQGGGI